MPTNSPKKKSRSRKSFDRSKTLIERDVQLLREWAKRKAEVELIVPSGGVGLAYVGRIVELRVTEDFDDFMFFSSAAKLRVLLFPWSWRKNEIDKTEGVYLSMHIFESARARSHVTIRETLTKRESNPNMSKAVAQFKGWADSHTKLLIIFGRGPHSLVFVGTANEISEGRFSLVEQKSAQLQLLLQVNDFEYAEVEQEGAQAAITLASLDSGWTCSISSRAESAQDLFKRFPLKSLHLH